jgi:D-alanine-D-alanine ligase
MSKIRVGIIFGGRSGEHEISLRSALTVIGALDASKYEIVPIGISRDGRWYSRADAMRFLTDATQRRAELDGAGVPVSLLPQPTSRGLVRYSEDGVGREAVVADDPAALGAHIDVIFPVLHGTYGEDGTVQGLLELAGIPYVGAGVLGSALGMDKEAQKRILRDCGIPVVRFVGLDRRDHREQPRLAARLADELGYPVFVKPNALGSSIGIRKVKHPGELAAALEDAFQYDRKALIEAACEGREIECSVLGNDAPEASVPGEIVIGLKHDFYSYESKYLDPDGAECKIPAALPPSAAERIRALAIAAFKALSLRGMARVDFLTRRDLSEIYVNEVNTIPGFTSISMYPKLWEASGVPLPRLIDRLIELALEEHQDRSSLKFTYQPKS